MLHTTGRETQVYIYNMDNMALGIYSSKSRNKKSMSTRRGGKMEREREVPQWDRVGFSQQLNMGCCRMNIQQLTVIFLILSLSLSHSLSECVLMCVCVCV